MVHAEQVEKEIGEKQHRPARVLSVDLLRGIVVAFMILVNDPGDWDHVFRQLDHTEWNGLTLTDLVFPWFLFLMGASLVFSLASRAAKGNCRKTMAAHIFSRGGRLALLAFAMVYLPRMHWTTMRYFGVLPRIAVCFTLAGLLLLITRRLRWLAVMVAGLLALYWVLLRWVPVPGYGMPGRDVLLLDPAGNLASYVDRAAVAWTQGWLHTGALYKGVRDPEGVLSTLPSVATVLMGSMAGVWMRHVGQGRVTVMRMRSVLGGMGLAAVVLAALLQHWMPINKNLWTPTFALVTAGSAATALSVCSLLVDARKGEWPQWLRAITWPWFVFGSNAIAAFVFSEAFVKIALYLRHIDDYGDVHTVWEWLYLHSFGATRSTAWTSLGFAAAFTVLCFLPNWYLWRRRIFLKI